MSKNNGGPAFPSEGFVCSDGIKYDGMTLRDYFAAKAMVIVPEMTAYNMKDNETRADYTARIAYKMADAMLAEREKDND
jgi:hypothetical protein